jgi:hypothetical protein
MNFKSILVVGLSIATLGLSLPAHAGDTATVIGNDQSAVITGDENTTNQTNKTVVTNRQSGRRAPGATGTSINSRQSADVQGNFNDTNQDNKTTVHNSQRRHR